MVKGIYAAFLTKYISDKVCMSLVKRDLIPLNVFNST